MSCDITSGITGACNTGIGGVENVYLSNNGTVWYKYEMDKGTASLVETYNVNQAASIIGYTQTLTMQLDKMAADKQQQIALIAEANGMQCLVETNDGNGFLFGVERGAYMASGTTTSGTAYTDPNQSEIVIQADSKVPMAVTAPEIIVGTLFLDVDQNDDSPLGFCGYTGPAANGYITFANTPIVDTYSAWNQYGCHEIWGGQGTPLGNTKSVYLTGQVTIYANLNATQAEWDVLYNSLLGVNTSNSSNYPGRGNDPDPIIFPMSTVLPATLPTNSSFVVPFSINLGPLNRNLSLSDQSFGVMLVNPAASSPVTGPWSTNIIQTDVTRLKAYLV